MQIIDAHAHVWSDDLLRWPLAAGFQRSAMRPARYAIEDLQNEMAANNVDRAVLVQVSYYGYDNAYLFGSVDRFPGQFAAITLIDQHSPHVTDLMLAHKTRGARGFRIYPRERPAKTWLDTEPLREMFAAAADHNLVLCCLIDPEALDALGQICARFSDTIVVVDHMGRIGMHRPVAQDDIDRLCALAAYPHVYVKVSAFYALGDKRTPYKDLIPMIRQLHSVFGADRLMWASDVPNQIRNGHCYSDSLSLARDGLDFLTRQERAALLGLTAQRLFFD